MAATIPGTIADLAARAGGLPVYLSGAFDLAAPVIGAVRGWFQGMAPEVDFIHARDLWRDLADWEARWPLERTRFGAMVLTTAAEAGAAAHVIGQTVATEIESFLAMRRPVGWLSVSPGPRLRFNARFAVEGFEKVDLVRYAQVLPAGDTEPFRPPLSVLTTHRGRPHLRVLGV